MSSSAASSSSNSQAPLDALAAAAQLHAGTAVAARAGSTAAKRSAHPASVERSTSGAAAAAAAATAAPAPAAAAAFPPAVAAVAAASAAAASTSVQQSESPTTAAKRQDPIRLLIPKALLCRTNEFRERPANDWLYRESPSIFRAPKSSDAGESSLYLYSVDERRWIIEVFPLPGCKQRLSQHDHPFCSLFVVTPPATPMEAAAASVAASAPRPVDRGVNINATLLDTIAATAAAAAAVRSFVRGPALFQPLDLLYNVSSRPFQLVVASRASYTGANMGLYGCDECVHLREGERVWYIAPPGKLQAFRDLFDGSIKETSTEAKTVTTKKAVAVTKASTAHTTTLLAHGVHAIHQKAGDTLYVPGGWVRAVKNLTDTVSFSSYYLRAWHLQHTIAFAEEEIKHGRLTADSGRVIDLPAIFHTLQQQTQDLDFGLSPGELNTVLNAWHASSAYALLNSSSSSGSSSSGTPAPLPAAGSKLKRKRSDREPAAAHGDHL